MSSAVDQPCPAGARRRCRRKRHSNITEMQQSDQPAPLLRSRPRSEERYVHSPSDQEEISESEMEEEGFCTVKANIGPDETLLETILDGKRKWQPNGKRDPLINGDYCLSVDGRYVFAVCYDDADMGENNPPPGLFVCDMWHEGARGVYSVPDMPDCTILGFTEYVASEALLMTKRQTHDGEKSEVDPDGFDLYKVTIDHQGRALRNPRLFTSFICPTSNAVVTWWGAEVFFLFYSDDRRTCKLHRLNPLREMCKQVDIEFPAGVTASDDCLFTNNGRIYMFSEVEIENRRRRGDKLIWIDFLHGFTVGTETMTPDPTVGDFPRRFGDICIESCGRLFAFCTVWSPTKAEDEPDATCWSLDLRQFTWSRWQHTALHFRNQPIVWLAVTSQGKGILLRQGKENKHSRTMRTRLDSFWVSPMPPTLKRRAWDTALLAAQQLSSAKRRRLIDTFAKFSA